MTTVIDLPITTQSLRRGESETGIVIWMANHPALFDGHKGNFPNKIGRITQVLYEICFGYSAKGKNIDLVDGRAEYFCFRQNRDQLKRTQRQGLKA